MLFQFDTIHSDDCKSGLQIEDSALAALILTTKMLFQLDSTDNDDCSSKPQQANKVFPSQGLDTDDWKPKPHLENCFSNSTLASTSENANPTQPPALILMTKMLFQLDNTDNDDCTSRPQQGNKAFSSQSLDTHDWKSKPHQEKCIANSTVASTSENAFPTRQYSQS